MFLMRYKIGQKIWYFDSNIWKPIQDVVYDYVDGMYVLADAGGYFEESELFTSSNKCWGERK